jgi:hypothetical protein
MSFNLTIDDFDPLVGYSNYADWQTPDPSVNPTWYNATMDVTGSPWHEGESSRKIGTAGGEPEEGVGGTVKSYQGERP